MNRKPRRQIVFPILVLTILSLLIAHVNGGAIWSFLPAPLIQAAKLYATPFEVMAVIKSHSAPPVIAPATLFAPHTSVKTPLTIGWILDTGAASINEVVGQTPGLCVLSPKWFHVDGLNGAIAGTPESTVIRQAHARRIAVWGVFDNGFNGALSHSILQYQDQQNMLIRRIVTLAVTNHLDGVNLDFEGLSPLDRWNYSRFVSVLATSLHAHRILLSIDLPPDYVSGVNTGPYDHRALAAAADYIILMGYDEHWLGDPSAGPTASIPWVRLAVRDLLQTGVPASKLVLGLPFYSVDFTVGQHGQVLSSAALSTRETSQLSQQLHSRLVWDAKDGVFFASYQSQGRWHKVWLENRRTLMLLAELARNDRLAGIAAWYLGLESTSTWLTVLHTLRSPTIID